MSINARVNNPLTIIAIFSALAEAFATAALIMIPSELQEIFVYFVMFFPVMLVALFFCILIFKNEVLYAPSDFENQEHYLEINHFKERVKKAFEEDIQNNSCTQNKFSDFDIKHLKRSIDNAVKKTELSTNRYDQIEYLIQQNPATTREIANFLRMPLYSTDFFLKELKNMGRIESYTEIENIDNISREVNKWKVTR